MCPDLLLCLVPVPQGQISRGAHYTLQKNSGDIWEVADGLGDKISAPGVCFMIPPPDAEAIALANQYVPPSLAIPHSLSPCFHQPRLCHQCCTMHLAVLMGGSCLDPCSLSRFFLLLEEFLRPPCTQDPTWQSGVSSETSRSPLLWGALWRGELPTSPSAGRWLPLLPVPCSQPSSDHTALPLRQHRVKVSLTTLRQGCLERGQVPQAPLELHLLPGSALR